MKTIIETNRLLLREFDISDASKMYELNDDSEVLRYTGDLPFKSIGEAEKFILNYPDYNRNGYGRWAVVLKSSNEFIGWCGLKLNEEGFVDIGFRFLKKFWNYGYGTEAAEATLCYGFNELRLHKIIGRASKDNIASIKILEKLKMTFWKLDTCHGIDNAAYYKINRVQFICN